MEQDPWDAPLMDRDDECDYADSLILFCLGVFVFVFVHLLEMQVSLFLGLLQSVSWKQMLVPLICLTSS